MNGAISGIKGFVFDGDDTLWRTEELYDQARERARLVIEGAGFDGGRWELLERRIDVDNVERFGFSPERFPTSCVQAYEVLAASAGVITDSELMGAIRGAANEVFRQTPALVESASRVLQGLRANGFKLALLTKGDLRIQHKRIAASGLTLYFDVIEVVVEKDIISFSRIASLLGIPLEALCMVGNSLRSDIGPALRAGLKAIWIDAHVWEYERNHSMVDMPSVVTAESLMGMASLFLEDYE